MKAFFWGVASTGLASPAASAREAKKSVPATAALAWAIKLLRSVAVGSSQTNFRM
ncbi:hypothetical protein [Azorhizobium doebereinerae]|uniref:hypothetical protein n=1 Tax=Azorhizobium doebereinerae TaxID=281091 RepID=UPI0012ECAA1A|nr:hypothetical protein [Azorhizobium doebereinerae]